MVGVNLDLRPLFTQFLRQFPFLGDCIIVRIFRGHESIVPHGDTEMRIGDRMIVIGSEEYVKELRELLEGEYH